MTITVCTLCSLIATSRCCQKVWFQAENLSVIAPSAAPARITLIVLVTQATAGHVALGFVDQPVIHAAQQQRVGSPAACAVLGTKDASRLALPPSAASLRKLRRVVPGTTSLR